MLSEINQSKEPCDDRNYGFVSSGSSVAQRIYLAWF